MTEHSGSRFHIPFSKHRLANGLTVILCQNHRLPQAAVNLWYHVGSKNEVEGRTGFAHLFEHLMFQGSEHYPDDFFRPLEEVGARLNGSTSEDRTNYWEVVPVSYLERALWLESDRMGWLLPAIDRTKLDNQREVVKNERRQTTDNQPYGVAEEACLEAIYPKGHPYHHSVIGSMKDLDAATLDDVKAFFRSYYTPNNASLCVAGDIESESALALVEKYFGAIPSGPVVSPVRQEIPVLSKPVRIEVEDRVMLPRLYLQWPTPTQLTGDDATLSVLAYVLSTGKDSRLVRRLQMDDQLAQSLWAYQIGGEVAGVFQVVVTAQRGVELERAEAAVWDEIDRIKRDGVEPDEVKAAVDSLKAGVIRRLQTVGGFGSVSDILNYYETFTGNPDGLSRELERIESVTPDSVRMAARQFLPAERHAGVSILPARPKTVAGDRSVMPGKGADKTFAFPEVKRTTLPNGAALWVLPDHSLPMVTLAAVVRAGSACDPADRPGTAYFTAGLLDESAAGMGPLELAKRQKALATSLATTVDGDQTAVALSVLKEHFEGGVALLGDVLMRPDFRPEDLERLRKEQLAGLVRKLDDPSELGDRTLKARLYGESTPYGHPVDGTPGALETLTREHVEAFYEAFYGPRRTLFLVVGDVTPEEAESAVLETFGPWRGRPQEAGEVPAEPRWGDRGFCLVPKSEAPQSYVAAAQPAISRKSPSYPAFVVFNAVLGGQFTSRVNMNLREDKGYTYGVHSYLEPRPGTMPWIVATSVQTDKTAESIAELRGEIERILAGDPVTEKEFANARDNLLLRYPQSFETQGQLASGLASLWLYDLPLDYHEKMLAALRSLELDDVRAAGADVLAPDRLVWVVVGDGDALSGSIRDAGLGVPETVSAPGRDAD